MGYRRLVTVSAILVLLLSMSIINAQEISTEYRFAYAYQSKQGEIDISIIDPSTSSSVGDTINLTVDKLWTLANIAKSSGGEFIALVFQNGVNQVVEVVNAKTHEMRSIATDVTLAAVSDTAMSFLPPMEWSPDGQYLALNLSKPHSQGEIITTDLFLYSVQENNLIALTHDKSLHTTLAWSLDSTELAATTVAGCPKGCTASIDLFDVATKKAITSVTITPEAVGANSQAGAGVCHLDWSPDARYISFMANCDSLEYGTYKEIYVLEIALQKLTRVTDFTFNQDVKAQDGFVFANYQPIWLDQSNLLISTAYGLANKVFETLHYNAETEQLTQISNQYAQEWAVNSALKIVALQNLGIHPSDYQYLSKSQPIDLTSFDAVHQANTATTELSSLATLPKGCNPQWSPDGKTLAYTMPKDDTCGGHINGFVFVNSQNEIATSYKPDFGDRDPFIDFVIGWVSG